MADKEKGGSFSDAAADGILWCWLTLALFVCVADGSQYLHNGLLSVDRGLVVWGFFLCIPVGAIVWGVPLWLWRKRRGSTSAKPPRIAPSDGALSEQERRYLRIGLVVAGLCAGVFFLMMLVGSDSTAIGTSPWLFAVFVLCLGSGVVAFLFVFACLKRQSWIGPVGFSVSVFGVLLWATGGIDNYSSADQADFALWGLACVSMLCGLVIDWLFVDRVEKPAPVVMPTSQGSARWATLQEIKDMGMIFKGGYPVGYFYDPQDRVDKPPYLVSYAGVEHRLICAHTGAGKFVSCIAPMLLGYVDSSAIVVDIKGEAARFTAGWRSQAGLVYVLDPWRSTGIPGASFNPLSVLTASNPDVAEDARALADSVFVEGNAKEDFWNAVASSLLSSILMYVALDPMETDRTMQRVREIVASAPADFDATIKQMQSSTAARGLVKRGADVFVQKAPNEASGVVSTMQHQTEFLDSPNLNSCMGTTTFQFEDLRKGIATVYIVLPPKRMKIYGRWVRMILSAALSALKDDSGEVVGPPIKIVIDEFPYLAANMKFIEHEIAIARGSGFQFHLVVQNLGQLKREFGDGWETYVNSCGVFQVFGVREMFTAKYISDMTGQTTRIVKSDSFSSGSSTAAGGGSVSNTSSASYSEQGRQLMTPREVIDLPKYAQIVFGPEGHPFCTNKILHYKDFPWSDNVGLKVVAPVAVAPVRPAATPPTAPPPTPPAPSAAAGVAAPAPVTWASAAAYPSLAAAIAPSDAAAAAAAKAAKAAVAAAPIVVPQGENGADGSGAKGGAVDDSSKDDSDNGLSRFGDLLPCETRFVRAAKTKKERGRLAMLIQVRCDKLPNLTAGEREMLSKERTVEDFASRINALIMRRMVRARMARDGEILEPDDAKPNVPEPDVPKRATGAKAKNIILEAMKGKKKKDTGDAPPDLPPERP